MKIGILTIQSPNYGNRLQNFALQETLREMGHDVLSIKRDRVRPKQKLKQLVRDLVKRDAYARCRAFDRELMRFSDSVVSKEHLTPGLAERFDKFVIGSDQVWNPTFLMNSELDYLPMVPKGKKIAYAASFGVSSLGQEAGAIAPLLADIGHVSMREEAGAELVEQLTGKPSPVVLDPTLLVPISRWLQLARRPHIPACDSPYLFSYFLGSETSEQLANDIATKLGLGVVRLSDYAAAIGPLEFIWVISHARFVCTDSFHGSVFSLLNHKPLAILHRADDTKDMFSRLQTLCDTFAAHDFMAVEGQWSLEAALSHDWVRFELILDSRRRTSNIWLEEALGKE